MQRRHARLISTAAAALLLAVGAATLGGCELLTSVDYTNAEANPCPEGDHLCNDGNCFNLQVTQQHCGACGRACPFNATCTNGDCACQVAGQTLCTLGCFDLQTDQSNCGACGKSCAGYPCTAGVCQVPPCRAPLMQCPSGCLDVFSDEQNCGACGRRCLGICSSGICISQPADASFEVGIDDAGADADASDGEADANDADGTTDARGRDR